MNNNKTLIEIITIQEEMIAIQQQIIINNELLTNCLGEEYNNLMELIDKVFKRHKERFNELQNELRLRIET